MAIRPKDGGNQDINITEQSPKTYLNRTSKSPIPKTLKAMSDATPATKTYSLRCHCGAHAATIETADLADAKSIVLHCNCSICTERGILLAFVAREKIRFAAGGAAEMRSYQFAKKKLDWRFCGECGSMVLAYPNTPDATPGGMAVFNVGAPRSGATLLVLTGCRCGVWRAWMQTRWTMQSSTMARACKLFWSLFSCTREGEIIRMSLLQILENTENSTHPPPNYHPYYCILSMISPSFSQEQKTDFYCIHDEQKP